MKPKVYLETSFLSLLTAHPSRDLVTAAMIKQSNDWWDDEQDSFDLFVSDLVGMEALAGDPNAAHRRQEVFRSIPALVADPEARSLADFFPGNLALPPNAANDALHITLHIAIATVNQMDYLLTWNCRHIANAVMRPKLQNLCRDQGYRCPVIYMPPELKDRPYEN